MRSPGRLRGAAFGGAVLVLVTLGAPWATGRITGVPGGGAVQVSGREAAPAALALALVTAAAALVLSRAGRAGTRLLGLALCGCGVALAGVAVPVARGPRDALTPAVVAVTGSDAAAAVPGAVTGVGVTPWLGAALVGALLVTVAGLGALSGGPGRPGERRGDHAASDDLTAVWDAVSRGEDPP